MADVPDADLAKFSKLFGALDEPSRKKLMALSTRQQFAKGTVICREGEEATGFYVVTRGFVTVSGDDFGNAKALATLGPGEFFGEMAALSGQKRQATVTALDAVEAISFPPAAIAEVLKAAPAALEVLKKAGLFRAEDAMKKLMGS